MSDIPAPAADWAMLLDVDGTLVDLADHPDAARADPALASILHNLALALNGAVALISGRRIDDAERVVGYTGLAMAGLHGLEVRNAAGKSARTASDSPRLATARAELAALIEQYPAMYLEDKAATIALHYRGAPQARAAAYQASAAIVARAGGELELLEGKSVLELKPAGSDKGQAVRAVLAEAPFCGRRPVYVGDDVTDEHAFSAVNDLGGISIRVGDNQQSAAHYRLARPQKVIEWLQKTTATLRGRTPALTSTSG